MSNDTVLPADDKTVLFNQPDQASASNRMTDSDATPRIEHLKDRMIYAAHQQPTQTFNISSNSLVTAAAALLSEVVRLKHFSDCQDLVALNTNLNAALNQFQSSALQSGTETSQVSSAHYVLCTVVDEAVVTTSWGEKSGWSKNSLLSSLHNETSGGEKFFQLLDSLSKNPVKHLPMLELMYLCLALGFQGKYRVLTRGNLELENISDALYRQIRQLRGDVPREFSPQWEGLKEQRRSLVRIVPGWMVALFTAVCLVAMYSSLAWVLGEQRDTVLQPFQQIVPAAVQLQSQR